jgi:hypothetical protein
MANCISFLTSGSLIFTLDHLLLAESAGPNRLRRFCFEQYWEDLDNGLIELGVDESKISGL